VIGCGVARYLKTSQENKVTIKREKDMLDVGMLDVRGKYACNN
jgi:hypothetical protein